MCSPCGYGEYDVECENLRKSYAGQNDDLPTTHDSEGRL